MGRLASVVVVGVIFVVAAFVTAGSVRAHFDDLDAYMHKACPASVANRVDPINVVFTGWGTWGRAMSQIQSHLGWTTTSGTTQSFVDHARCYSMHAQRASGQGSRFHMRVRGQHKDTGLGWTATGDAHHEDLVTFPLPCGHAVDSSGPGGSGFDQGRDELERRFAGAGHATSWVWWGNTHSFKQCDGDYAASDGWTVFVELHQVNHS